MEALEAIKNRKSIRVYKPDPVPGHLIKEILDAAVRAPSWGNTQPWEFAVVGGPKLKELQKLFQAKAEAGAEPAPDLPFPSFPERLRQRTQANAAQRLELQGIPREDRERRRAEGLRGSRLFDAPVAIYVYMERELNPYALMDLGFVLQNIMVAAHARGLGSVPLAAGVRYGAMVREFLGIPDSKALALSLALGYPDPKSPLNQFASARVPLGDVVSWHGVDGA